MSFADVKDETFYCTECKATITVEYVETLTDSELHSVWLEESLNEIYQFHHEGICETCYQTKYNDPVNEKKAGELISRMDLYSRNIRNIISENFSQDGAATKFNKYETLIRQCEHELNGRSHIYGVHLKSKKSYLQIERTPVPDTPDVIFYYKEKWADFYWKERLEKIIAEVPIAVRLKVLKARRD